MTYRQAHTAMHLCLSYCELTAEHIRQWNAIEDALFDLTTVDFQRVAQSARADNTPEAAALVCICD